MKDKRPIEHAIQQLEARIAELRDSLNYWDSLSVNISGAKAYKEKAKRIVLDAKTIESLIRENVFPNY
jgi:hypothetical protein